MKIVAAGIIFCQNKILIAQRIRNKAQAYLWEFPGGKLEPGETMEQCLEREILEELALPITVDSFLAKSEFDYQTGSIQLNGFLAHSQTQNIGCLNSHEAYHWIEINELDNYEFAPADLPLIEKLKELYIDGKIDYLKTA